MSAGNGRHTKIGTEYLVTQYSLNGKFCLDLGCRLTRGAIQYTIIVRRFNQVHQSSNKTEMSNVVFLKRRSVACGRENKKVKIVLKTNPSKRFVLFHYFEMSNDI